MNFFIVLLDAIMITYVFISGVFCALVPLMKYFPDDTRKKVYYSVDCILKSSCFTSFWFILSLLFLWMVLLSLILRRKKNYISKKDIVIKSKEGNEVFLSNRAITDFINKIVTSIDGVESAHVEVFGDKNRSKIILKIKVSLWEGSCYPDINEQIQHMVRSKMASDMGVYKISAIPVSLDRMVPINTPSDSLSEEVLD